MKSCIKGAEVRGLSVTSVAQSSSSLVAIKDSGDTSPVKTKNLPSTHASREPFDWFIVEAESR